jgi:hypothetical protein
VNLCPVGRRVFSHAATIGARRMRQNPAVTFHIKGGNLRYRLIFQTRPDLDSDDFISDQVYDTGMAFNAPELPGEWMVVDVLFAPDGKPDTLLVAPKPS